MASIQSKTYLLNTLKTYKYVVILSRYEGNILLSRHRKRTTWETQGGHVEPGETPLEAARCELFEECGAVEYTMVPLCDYRAEDGNTGHGANGVIFAADIRRLASLPQSEMAEVRTFASLPENVTYPAITPDLFAHLDRMGGFEKIFGGKA